LDGWRKRPSGADRKQIGEILFSSPYPL